MPSSIDATVARWSTVRRLGASSAAGALVGFSIGGVGGRIAMLGLRLTSDPALHGRPTDDGFTIGIVSGETTFLLIATTVLGAAAGASYLMFRRWLPDRGRAWTTGILGGVVGGAAIIKPHGVDFTALDPLPLAVVLFIAIPFAGAAGIAVVVERILRGSLVERHSRWLLGLTPLVLIAAAGPTTAIGVAIVVVVALAMPESRARGPRWVPPVVAVAGRVALVAIGAIASVALVQDVVAVL